MTNTKNASGDTSLGQATGEYLDNLKSGSPQIGDSKPAGRIRKAKNSKTLTSKKETKRSISKRGRQKNSNGVSELGNKNRQKSKATTTKKDQPKDYLGRYEMLVHRNDAHVHLAIVQGKELLEYSLSSTNYTEREIFGNIYMGVVSNVYKGMDTAFIDIGTNKNAILRGGDMIVDMEEYGGSNGVAPSIDQALRPNQHVLCQVTKNPIAHKGARLTQEIALPGRYVVLFPKKDIFTVFGSASDSVRKRLRRVVGRMKPKDQGIIVRTAAANASEEDINQDLNILIDQWRSIEAVAQKASAPSLVYRGANAVFRLIRDQFNEDFKRVLIDDEELYNDIRSYLQKITPSLADRVRLFDTSKKKLDIWDQNNIEEQRDKALDTKVLLPSGAELVIERTEALTVVDVNTARNTGSHNLEDTVLMTNLEAANEIAKQLRLRDIGGIIVIDFIDLKEKSSRDTLIKELKNALAQDPTNTKVEDYVSRFGLVQMTRKRIGEDLLDSLSDVCEDCDGKGYERRNDIR